MRALVLGILLLASVATAAETPPAATPAPASAQVELDQLLLLMRSRMALLKGEFDQLGAAVAQIELAKEKASASPDITRANVAQQAQDKAQQAAKERADKQAEKK